MKNNKKTSFLTLPRTDIMANYDDLHSSLSLCLLLKPRPRERSVVGMRFKVTVFYFVMEKMTLKKITWLLHAV